MKQARRFLSGFWRSRGGATAVEYAMIGCLIGCVVVGGATTLGKAAAGLFSGVSTTFAAAVGP